MRIAYVSHITFPDAVGDNYCAIEMARRMSRRGHETTLVAWNKKSPSLNSIERIDGVEIWRLAGVNLRLAGHITDYPYAPRMSNALKQIDPDIVHVRSHLFMTSIQAVKSAISQKRSVIVTVHGVMAKRQLFINMLQKAYLFTLAPWIFRKAAVTICLTKSDAEEIMALGCPQERIRIISNPVDVEIFRPRAELEEEDLVVWVGRFVPEKGLGTMISAAHRVALHSPGVRFVLVGDGPMAGKVRHLIKKLGLEKNILLAGVLSPKQVSEIVARASVFLFTSLKEGLPKVVLEAMSSGKAVVASNISGVSELIRTGYDGILVEPRDTKAFAEAITHILEDKKLRKKLGSKARDYVLRNHTWDRILDLTEEVYEEVSCVEVGGAD